MSEFIESVIIEGFNTEETEQDKRYYLTTLHNLIKHLEEDLIDVEKFECAICGCYFWVKDRNNFDCPNCEDKNDN